MDIQELRVNWDGLGKTDPLWAVLTAKGRRGNKWDQEAFFETGRQELDAHLQRLQKLGLLPVLTRALDFGCGVGRFTQALTRHFAAVVGVDIAPSMIDLADRFNAYPDRCNYILNDKDDLSVLQTESFSFVYSCITLQHIEPRYSKNYIKEFLRLLEPAGTLLFQVPAAQQRVSLKQTIKAKIDTAFPGFAASYRRLRHGGPWKMEMHCIPEPEVTKLVEDSGGTVADVDRNVDEYGFLNVWYSVTKRRRQKGQ
jgi:SAM-dependent methyltransferase